MAPRAAARLATLGFAEVLQYKGGKLDWMAAGLPTEGENPLHPRAGDVARKDVPTCSLSERLGDVAERVRVAGFDAALAVDAHRVVLGVLRSKELAKDPSLTIEEAMRPGPSTFRPYVSLPELPHAMEQHHQETPPVTTPHAKTAEPLSQEDPAPPPRNPTHSP